METRKYTGKTVDGKDGNGLPVKKARFLIVHEGHEREASDNMLAFQRAVAARTRGGFVDLEAKHLKSFIDANKDNPKQAITVAEFTRGLVDLDHLRAPEKTLARQPNINGGDTSSQTYLNRQPR